MKRWRIELWLKKGKHPWKWDGPFPTFAEARAAGDALLRDVAESGARGARLRITDGTATRPTRANAPSGDVYLAGVSAARLALRRGLRSLPHARSAAWWTHQQSVGVWGIPSERESFEAGFTEEWTRIRPRRQNPLTRSETALVVREARFHKTRAQALAGYPGGLLHLGRAAAYRDVARRYGKAGGVRGTQYRAAMLYGPPAPGDPDSAPRRRERPGLYLGNPLTRPETAAVLRDARISRDLASRSPRGGPARAFYDGESFGKEQVARRYGVRPRRAAFMRRVSTNPRLRALGPIPGAMQEIRYRRTGPDAGLYRHRFGRQVRAVALSDGSVLLTGPRRLFVSQ